MMATGHRSSHTPVCGFLDYDGEAVMRACTALEIAGLGTSDDMTSY